MALRFVGETERSESSLGVQIVIRLSREFPIYRYLPGCESWASWQSLGKKIAKIGDGELVSVDTRGREAQLSFKRQGG